MSISRCRVPAVVLVIVASLTCGATALAQSPDASQPRSNVHELVTFVPPTADSVGFTDWGRIKASQGAEDVTGASPIDEKLQVALSTGTDEGTASAFGAAHLRDHYDTWAFDALDLDWEATIQGDGPPMFVLRFRDGFDLEPVAALFDERGFTTSQIQGGVLRTHELSVSDDWLRISEFGILNTAFLDDDQTLVLSTDVDAVLDVAANHGSLPSDPALDATAEALDGASAALLLLGLGVCLGLTPLPIDVGDALASPDLTFPTSGLHPYQVLGIGYSRPGWSPIGRITFGYAGAATAQADLPGRLALANTGTSQRVGQRYADVLFELASSRVDDAILTLDVVPHDDSPRRLFDMAFARDMTFAGC